MSQTNLDTAIATKLALLLKCEYGSQVKRYAGWTDQISISGDGTYVVEPTVEFDLGTNHGGVDDKISSVKISSLVEPFATMIQGYAHAPVRCTLAHCDPSDPDGTFRILRVGRLGKVRKNPGGSVRLVRGEVEGLKSRLDTHLGFYTTPTCQWWFGQPGCDFDLASVSVSGTVVAVNFPINNSVQVSFGVAPDLTNRRWARGFLEVDGLRIMIRQVQAGTPATFELSRIPPPSWNGATVLCVPGCDKQLSTCRDVWDNARRWQGIGISIPPYNPILASA